MALVACRLAMLLLDAGVMYRITCASRAVTVNADRLAGRCHAWLMYRIMGHYHVIAGCTG
jgi:hypothetical protein